MRLSTTEDSEWVQKEAAILALGAVAEGCISGLLPHLAQVLVFLLVDQIFGVCVLLFWTFYWWSSMATELGRLAI